MNPVLGLLSCKKHIPITPHYTHGYPPKISIYLKQRFHTTTLSLTTEDTLLFQILTLLLKQLVVARYAEMWPTL